MLAASGFLCFAFVCDRLKLDVYFAFFGRFLCIGLLFCLVKSVLEINNAIIKEATCYVQDVRY